MTTYTFKISALDVYPSHEGVTNAVYNVHWRLLADDGEGHVADNYGTQVCGPINPEDFTPFEDLTEAQVQGWVEAAMGEEFVSNLKAGLDAQIAQQIAPTSLTLAPAWA
jgi:hypothetical protein